MNISYNTSSNELENSPNDQIYFELGKTHSLQAKASVDALKGGLAAAYSEFQKREKNFTSQRIGQYESQIQQILDNKNSDNAKLSELNVLKKFKNDEILDKEEELNKANSESPSPDYIPFSIGTFIVILLTFYLFMFYASTGYSAFFGMPKKLIGGFLAPTVFNDAGKYGGGALAFIVLFPIVFLAMGFLIHVFLEKKQYFQLIGILMFTLLFDVFMAYKIAEMAHTANFNRGVVTDSFTSSSAYKDINFYIIIAAGFVVYLIWGYLLNFIINEWKKLQPDQLKKTTIDSIRKAILLLTQEKATLESELTILQARIEKSNSDIDTLKHSISVLKSGGIVIDTTALKGTVGKFMGGWFATINYLFLGNSDEISSKIGEASSASENWLEETISNLKQTPSVTLT